MKKPSRKLLFLICASVVVLIVVITSVLILFSAQGSSVTLESYVSEATNARQLMANWLMSKYNSTYHLLQGASAGGCGFQPYAFQLLPDNFLAGRALEPYNASVAKLVQGSTDTYLTRVDYQNNYRLEMLFGNPIPYPPQSGKILTVEGTAPSPSACTKSVFWIVTEVANTTSSSKSYSNMGFLVAGLLEQFRAGNTSAAQNLFNAASSWWTSDSDHAGGGLLTPQAKLAGQFVTRDICYFLFAQRATRFPVSEKLLNESETRLWIIQNRTGSGALPTSYEFNGSVPSRGARPNILTNSLCLLSYDPRIQTTWWPQTSFSGQPPSSPYSIMRVVANRITPAFSPCREFGPAQ